MDEWFQLVSLRTTLFDDLPPTLKQIMMFVLQITSHTITWKTLRLADVQTLQLTCGFPFVPLRL